MTALTEATSTTRTASAAAKALRRSASRPRSHADGMAVASFILGLLGTLVLNLVLGPCALVLGGLALARGTDRRGRALLGIALGAADLLLLALLVTTDGTVSWHIGS
ncbi:hypothetical protein [Streptomyces inhibens]|uniref:hypothetical protein n=1 Tax=Streptomyces inhibens TaxID=2293571 RepID=UPI0015F29FFE|nr:hypothetical protein [Streptomyces inhibens]